MVGSHCLYDLQRPSGVGKICASHCTMNPPRQITAASYQCCRLWREQQRIRSEQQRIRSEQQRVRRARDHFGKFKMIRANAGQLSKFLGTHNSHLWFVGCPRWSGGLRIIMVGSWLGHGLLHAPQGKYLMMPPAPQSPLPTYTIPNCLYRPRDYSLQVAYTL